MTQVVQEMSSEILSGPPPATKRPENYLTLDAWRGVAALSVCVYHSSAVIVDKQLNGHSTPFYDVCMYGFLGVQIFFVISGYCIAASAASVLRNGKPLSNFVIARIRRIYPACWASLLLILGLQVLATTLVRAGILHDSTMANTSVSHDALFWFSNVTLTQVFLNQNFISAVCWTLCYEIAFYMLVAAAIVGVRVFSRHRSVDRLLLILHGVSIISLVGLIASRSHVPFPFDLWPQFGLGIVAFHWLNGGNKRIAWVCSAIIGLLTCVFIASRNADLSVMHLSSRLVYTTSLVFAACVIPLRSIDTRMSKSHVVSLLRWIGLFSYSLYLTHFVMLGMINQLLRIGLKTSAYHYLQMPVSVFLAVVAGWLFYLVAEKPFLAKSRS